jgi:hypothetical protein
MKWLAWANSARAAVALFCQGGLASVFCQGDQGTSECYSGEARIRRFPRLLEGLTMTKRMKTKTDLFAVLEDDIKQFRDALFGVLRAAPQQITLAIRRGLGTKDRQTSGQAIADRSRPMD